jgi:hypothetical protein
VPLRIVVSDASCLIDLRKVSLLEPFLRLPYECLIPDTLFDEELLKFSSAQKKALLRGGLKVMELPGEGVLRAREIAHRFAHLSIHDSFAYALAESWPGCILLTGDGPLRAFARERKIEVHGVLWVVDELHGHKISTTAILHSALQALAKDPTVRLPRHELTTYLKRYAGS